MPTSVDVPFTGQEISTNTSGVVAFVYLVIGFAILAIAAVGGVKVANGVMQTVNSAAGNEGATFDGVAVEF